MSTEDVVVLAKMLTGIVFLMLVCSLCIGAAVWLRGVNRRWDPPYVSRMGAHRGVYVPPVVDGRHRAEEAMFHVKHRMRDTG